MRNEGSARSVARGRLARTGLFSLFYGLVVVDWVDLFKHATPDYSVWLALLYVSPIGFLFVIEDYRRVWPLAVVFGLISSLANDLGYLFVGDLVFSFGRPILPWLAGQLGFLGLTPVSSIHALMRFRAPINSLEMGAWVWLRVGLLAALSVRLSRQGAPA